MTIYVAEHSNPPAKTQSHFFDKDAIINEYPATAPETTPNASNKFIVNDGGILIIFLSSVKDLLTIYHKSSILSIKNRRCDLWLKFLTTIFESINFFIFSY